MSNHNLDRRTFLGLAGTTTLIGLAGCTASEAGSGESEADETDTSTPTATATATEQHEDEHEETSQDAEADHHEEEEHHGDGETHTEGGHSGDGPAEHATVNMQTTADGQHFHPHVAWVEPGATVTFVNESGTHTATAYHPDNGKPQRIPDDAESFDSGLLTEEGATWEHTFETEGVYDIYCAPHEQLGMIGTVLVGKPDAHGQPGLAEPQSEMSDTVASKIRSLNEQCNSMLGHDH